MHEFLLLELYFVFVCKNVFIIRWQGVIVVSTIVTIDIPVLR